MASSRTEKSTRTAIASFLNSTLEKVLSFVSKTVFIHVFGREMLGLNGLFTNVISLLCLADLGFGTAMAYSYYKPIAENDTKKIAALNKFYSKVYLIIAAVVSVAGVAFVPFLDSFVNLDHEIEHMYLYYAIAVFKTVCSYLFAYKQTLITAHQHGYVISRYMSVSSTISTIIQIAITYVTRNYIAYLMVDVVFTIINNLIISHQANKLYPYIKEKSEPLPKADRRGIFSNMGSIFLYKFSSVLINGTDNLLISKMVSTVAVGDYSNYLMPINMLTKYASIVFYSFTASLGNMMVSDSKEKQYRIFKIIQTMSAWFGIVISACTFALVDDFIILWLGKDFLVDKYTVCAICINFLLTCLLYPIWIYREAAGIYLKTKYIMTVTAVLNIGLSILMGKWIGMAGIIFASAVSKLLTYVWYEPIILFRDHFKKSVWGYFVSFIATLVISCGAAFGVKLLADMIPLSGILGFIVKGIVCFAATNILYFLLYFRNPYFKELLLRVKSLVGGVLGKFKKAK